MATSLVSLRIIEQFTARSPSLIVTFEGNGCLFQVSHKIYEMPGACWAIF